MDTQHERAYAAAYEELQAIARRHLRGERHDHTLETSGLVNEAWIRVAHRIGEPDADPATFRAMMCVAMRRVLVDHARARAAARRGGSGVHVTLHTSAAAVEPASIDVLQLDAALAELGRRDPRLEAIVECHLFGGMSKRETADTLGLSTRTVERDWLRARAYLMHMLQETTGSTDPNGEAV